MSKRRFLLEVVIYGFIPFAGLLGTADHVTWQTVLVALSLGAAGVKAKLSPGDRIQPGITDSDPSPHLTTLSLSTNEHA